MAKYYKSIRANRTWTVAPRTTISIGWSWENDKEEGADQGAVVFMADPVSGQSEQVRLVTYDIGKRRRGPAPPTKVYYAMKIRNDSDITAKYGMEIVTFKDDLIN